MNIRDVFACGVDPAVFDRRHEDLPPEEQDRLQRVARRVWLTLVLRYQTIIRRSPFESPYDWIMLSRWELPSIEVYLLCTCLDTLAGKSDYRTFWQWLNTRAIDRALTMIEIGGLHAQYMEEYGVGLAFRRLFDDLSTAVKNWLASNVSIRPSDHPIADTDIDSQELVSLLRKYFYTIWRNPYTHRSMSRQTSVADDTRIPSQVGWWITPASGTMFEFQDGRTGETWDFSFREGLDEATILRVIIHASVLRMMGVEVKEGTIESNLRGLSKMSAVYDFVGEVNWNASLAGDLLNLGDRMRDDFGAHIVHVGIPEMSLQRASYLMDRLRDNQLEMGMSQMAAAYSQEVGQIIEEAGRFNSTHPPKSPGDNIEERWKIVLKFVRRLTPVLKSILEWPSRNEMSNLWLVLREPC